ncbi:MAG: TonB-dependent receptor, partial [Bacteroidota bacterium]
RLEEVVVSGDRNEVSRIESPVIITSISPKLISCTQSMSVCDALNYCPGLRVENKCQNCGFTQVRMNGLEGPYTQILVNSHPVFSSLAGVYGLELTPANMIERVEIIRGGNSTIYGSSAIAGTVNLILKDPLYNSYELGYSGGFFGEGANVLKSYASDNSIFANTSIVSDDRKSGLSMFANYRDRKPFDANDDGFSDIPHFVNNTFGSRFYHRMGANHKINADFFIINEDRRGGNRLEYPLHEADIAEASQQHIKTGSLAYEWSVHDEDVLSLYGSVQQVGRSAYNGAGKTFEGYYQTESLTGFYGISWKIKRKKLKINTGIDMRKEGLGHEKLAYADLDSIQISGDSVYSIYHHDNVMLVDQNALIAGMYVQGEYEIGRFHLTAGARFDHYSIKNLDSGTITGIVPVPRINILYDINDNLQLRAGYSEGYRVPQIFDEDLHVEVSGIRRVFYKNDADLVQENSESFMASVDYHGIVAGLNAEILAEGFYTVLENPFISLPGQADSEGNVVCERMNANDGAMVKGVNMELSLVPSKKYDLKAGLTMQDSRYNNIQQFNTAEFLRTPDLYGFMALNVNVPENLAMSLFGTYTGTMLVPYYGLNQDDPDAGSLHQTKSFFDIGTKIEYRIKLNGISLKLFAGIKNMFNTYQDDLERGIDRDAGYIYGPSYPRYVFVGAKLGK